MSNFLVTKPSSLDEAQRSAIMSKANIFSSSIEGTTGDILLISQDQYVIFVILLACMITKNKLHVCSTSQQADKLLLSNSIGTLILDSDNPKHIVDIEFRRYFKYIDTIISINRSQFKYSSDVYTWYTFSTVRYKKEVDKSRNADLAYLRQTLLFNKYNNFTFLTLYLFNEAITVSYKNIFSALDSIDIEFRNHKADWVSFHRTNFENSYPYLLYFLFTSKTLVFEHTNIVDSFKNKKKLVFVDKKHQKSIYEYTIKPLFYKRLGIILNDRKKLLKPFVKLYNSWILKKTFDLNLKDELVLLDNYLLEGLTNITKESFNKVSYTIGKYQMCNILGINRPADKKLNISEGEYRIFTSDPDFRFHTNSLNQLLVRSSSVSIKYLKELSKKTQKRELYYNTTFYCDILNKKSFRVMAVRDEILYSSDFEPFNIGFVKRTLLSLPYIKDALVSIRKGENNLIFIPFVSINRNMAKLAFGYHDYFTIEKHLEEKLKIAEELLKTKNIKISKVVIVEDSLFNSVDKHYEDRYYFIRSISNSTAN